MAHQDLTLTRCLSSLHHCTAGREGLPGARPAAQTVLVLMHEAQLVPCWGLSFQAEALRM